MKWRRLAVKYALTTTVAGAVTLLILRAKDFSTVLSPAEQYRILSDAFAVPGVILMLVAALVWVSNDGFFDGLGYIVGRGLGTLIPFFRPKHETYYDHLMSKKEKRIRGYSFLFFVGLVFTLVSVIFIGLFESASVPNV